MTDAPVNGQCDVAVIGAGPSGLAAATALKALGVAKVVVLEREPEPGGVPRHCGHPPFGMREFGRVLTGPAYARNLAKRARRAGVEIALNTHVTALDPGGALNIVTPDGSAQIRAQRVLLATGVRESPRSALLAPGDRAAGVCNTGALQAMVYLKNRIPFRRPVVVGTELVSFSSLWTCRRAGVAPVAMLEQGPRPIVRWPLHLGARALGVPLHLNTRITAIIGAGRVEAVRVADASGREREIVCDGVLFTGRFTPEASLVRMSHLALDPATGGPVIDQFGRCSDPAYFAAGNVLRPVETAGWSWREGRAIAARIAKDLSGDLLASGSAAPSTIRIETSSPVSFAIPQRLRRPAPGPGMKHVQVRVERPARGRLVVRAGDQLLWSRSMNALPERRILIPLAPLQEAQVSGDLRIELEEGGAT